MAKIDAKLKATISRYGNRYYAEFDINGDYYGTMPVDNVRVNKEYHYWMISCKSCNIFADECVLKIE